MIHALLLALAVSASAEDPQTVLMSAAYNGPLADVRAALQSGADVNALDADGESALMYAVSGGHDDIASYLLKKGANVDAVSTRGDTALHYAALKDRATAAKMLLSTGASFEMRNENGSTPLLVAVSHGSVGVASALLAKGADVNAAAPDGATPLMTAILQGQDAAAKLLVDKGADVNARDKSGSTALIAAAFKGRLEIAQMLVDKGADARVADNHSETAAEYAKAAGNYGLVDVIEQALLVQNADKVRAAQEAKEREAAERAAMQAKIDAQAQAAREEQARRVKLFLAAAAAGLVLALGAGAFGISAARKRKERRAKEREGERMGVLSMAAVDALQGYEALRRYEDRWRDLSVFPADILLKLYEARDRAKQSTPEKLKARADAKSKADAVTNIRLLIRDDPREAYTALQRYAADYGGPPEISGEELMELYDGAGRDGELLSGGLKLTDEQQLGVAAELSRRDRHEAAVRLVSAEPLLSQTIRVDEGCDEVVGIFDRADALPRFYELLPPKSHEFQTAFARAFLHMGRPRDALKVMDAVRVKDRDDQALIAAALLADGRRDDALRALDDVPKSAWSYAGWSSFLLFCLKTGRWEEAREAFDHVVLLRPLRRDPKLHYSIGLACEAAGRADMAGEVFHAFVKSGYPYKDSFARASRLPRPPDQVRRPIEADADHGSDTRVGGRYDLRSQIGTGNLGTTFAAYDSKTGKKAALKKLKAELAGDQSARARFLHQAKLAARVDHPGMIPVRDVIEEGGDVYLVFDFAEGRTLDKLLADKKRLTLSEMRTILEPVCQALEHGHLRNVLHLALKPSAIMVGPDGKGRVMDFGLRSERRAPDAYSAPELAGAPSRACDVYSLGAILREAAGAKPPRELEKLIAAALHADPKERIADTIELLAELKRAASSV